MKAKTTGLYVHIPFCRSKCAYCDFYSLAGKTDRDRYVNALEKHLEILSADFAGKIFDSVYIGGGTPTTLEPLQLEKLLSAIARSFAIEENGEFTVEANPKTLTKDNLSVLKEHGVNRLSIGLQSANENELRALGRTHTFADFTESFELARRAGFDNISADLMYGIPHETKDSLAYSIDALTSLDPEHISLYGLKIEENTPFFRMKDCLDLPDDDYFCEMYLSSVEKLAQKGYVRYEISNFSKPGRESRHNLRYWNMEDYLGVGPAAHSFVESRRYSYFRDVAGYIEAVENGAEPPHDEDVILTEKDLFNEKIMLGMRLEKGIDPESAGRLDREKILAYRKSGHLIFDEKGLRFTSEGFLVSNYILSDLIDF